MPRGHAERPAGLFRPDRQYRFARPGPRGLTLDRGDGTGGRERASLCPAGEQWAKADAQARSPERDRCRDVGLRDPLSIGAATSVTGAPRDLMKAGRSKGQMMTARREVNGKLQMERAG